MLVKSLDDVEIEFEAEEVEMAATFAGWQPLKPQWAHSNGRQEEIEYFSPNVIRLRSLKTSCQTQKNI